MDNVLIELLPLIAGAALVPLYPVIVLLLLQSQGGLAKATAFVSGGIVVRLIQGVLFGLIIGAAAQAYPDEGQGPIVSTLLLVVGLLLLIAGFRKWRKEEDPDAPPPQWMDSLSGMTTVKAARAGALYVSIAVKQWVFTLTAISLIGDAELGLTTGAGVYLFYVLATQALVLPPLLAYAVAPERSAAPLAAAQNWLEKYNRPIVISVSLIFGAWFFYRGVSGLIG